MLMYMLRNPTMMSRQQKLPGIREEFFNFHFWKAVRCEFLISLLYVFVGCGCLTELTYDMKISAGILDLKVALGFGLATATLVQCVGHISGAHMNPAVTLAMLVTRNITVLRAVFYMVAQCVGAIAGAAILFGLTPHHTRLGPTVVNKDIGLVQAFGVEFMITFLLVFTVFANVDIKRADMGSRSLSIGLAVILGHLLAFQYTGASMNPARSLGPAVIMNVWKHHWIYWVGPLLGGIIGGFTYEYTHDSSDHLQYLRRSFRRSRSSIARPNSLKCSSSITSTLSTEMTYTPKSEDLRI